MRIIRGKYGRRRFTIPKTFKARPTTDMAKENLFNILENLLDWEETKALDLFAGTGSIGLELVSRGCPLVVGVERDADHCAFIRTILSSLGEEGYRLLRTDALRYISTSGGGDCLFDFIFADPPYSLPELPELPDRILHSGLLSSEGLLVLEHPRAFSFCAHPAFFQERSYGSVHFSFFSHKCDDDACSD